MEINTGISRSIVGEDTFKQLWPEELQPTITLTKRTYTDELIPVLGVARVTVNQCKVLELLVAASAGPSLIGPDWLHDLKLDSFTVYKLRISCSHSYSSTLLCSVLRLGNSNEQRPRLLLILLHHQSFAEPVQLHML